MSEVLPMNAQHDSFTEILRPEVRVHVHRCVALTIQRIFLSLEGL
jgi:hypothetical protein